MSDNSSSEEARARFKKLASGFQPKLPRKLALLLPHKTQIEELLAMRASYDDIRILLEDAAIVVSKDTVYRFCRKVIGRKPVRQRNADAKEITPFKISAVQQPPPESIQASLREQRKLIPGPWSRRKPGPRIADSKNL
jgi:hypothetical protein